MHDQAFVRGHLVTTNDGVRYTDPLAVRFAFRDPNAFSRETSDYFGYDYASRLVACGAVLAFRLGRRPD